MVFELPNFRIMPSFRDVVKRVSTLSFDGHRVIEVMPSNEVTKFPNVEFFFKTVQRNAVIFHLLDAKHVNILNVSQ